MTGQSTVVTNQLSGTESTWVSNSLNSFSIGQTSTPLLKIIPRRADRIFSTTIFSSSTTQETIVGTQIRNRLPHWRSRDPRCFSLDSGLRIKEVECRFFIDFATQIQGLWSARKKLTVLCLYCLPDGRYLPACDVPVRLTRSPANHPLRFVLSNGNLHTELSNADRPRTDGQGMAEFTIAHPVQAMQVSLQNVTLTVEADVPLLGEGNASTTTNSLRMSSNFAVTIKRNSDETTLQNIYDQPRNQDTALNLWCFQPTAQETTNAGIIELQEVINEVVSRNLRINDFHFVPLTGIFDQPTRTALSQYLTNFNGISSTSGDYPYDLTTIGPDNEFITCIQEDYAPFNPTLAANRGGIVDRRMLIGDLLSTNQSRIDGLWELYAGVVQVLKSEMVRTANDYINCNTFWLHRSAHQPYNTSPNYVVRILSDNIQVKTAIGNASPNLTDAAGNGVVVNAGQLFASPQRQGNWYEITIPGTGNGWVQLTQQSGRRIRDDQSIAQNSGLHGGSGVVYSYGCKDLVQAFVNQLNTNPDAPPVNEDGNMLRIAHWDEYANGHKVGRDSGQAGWQGNDRIPYHTGCDCGGLVQNSITQAVFNNATRIVPNNITRAIVVNANRVPLHAIAASAFVGNQANARLIPVPQNASHNWIRQGDLITSPGHVVFFAEDRPNVLNGNRTFEVFNEYGNFRYHLPNGQLAPVDPNRFLRKALRMPFYYWGIQLNGAGIRVGKVYIWG